MGLKMIEARSNEGSIDMAGCLAPGQGESGGRGPGGRLRAIFAQTFVPKGGAEVSVDRVLPGKDDADTRDSQRAASGLHLPRFALLFPGQGSQRPGMAARLLEISRAARAVFEEADRALDFSLSRLCVEADADELADTENTQPAVLATSVAYFEYLKERVREIGGRLTPSAFAGHSLGQFSAAVAAEAVPLGEGLQLVSERGRIMKEWAQNRPGGLATVLGLAKPEVEEICAAVSADESVAIAVHNAPNQFVISGDIAPLERAMQMARERGASVKRLPISVPGHTPVMRAAAEQLKPVILRTRFATPTAPVVSNIDGDLLTTADEVMQELSDQICEAVEWVRCMGTLVNQGISNFVEVGPGRTLSNIARRFSANLPFLTVEDARPDQLRVIGQLLESGQPA
jgi:[acyl-carrier-protein] S-malonyltransferase